MLSLLVVIACLPLLIESSNLGLTFDANKSVCTASCTTCSSDTTPSLTGYNHTFIMELLNATMSNGQAIKETKEAVDGIIRSLSLIKDTIITNAGAINDILLLVEDLVALHSNSSSSSFSPLIPTSCEEIKNKQPNSPSGVYLLATGNETTQVYCNMEELCGSGGGWTRLAYLDMSDATQNCPSGFRLYQSGGVRACGRPATNSGSCESVQFPSTGISYSQVCGRVVGYQYVSPDALHDFYGSHHNNLNSFYVDGVSITRGSPRQHVWTLIADSGNAHHFNCPCNIHNNKSPQSFIGSHYFCEAGSIYSGSSTLYTSNPLWDGQGCRSAETACCTAPGLPWFHRDYGNTTTTDYLELRVCADEGTGNEDVPVGFYEIYVK